MHLIPWPKTLEIGAGDMQLSADTRIVAGEEQLQPLAEVLSGEIALLTGLKLKATTGPSRAGDIVLQIDKAPARVVEFANNSNIDQDPFVADESMSLRTQYALLRSE